MYNKWIFMGLGMLMVGLPAVNAASTLQSSPSPSQACHDFPVATVATTISSGDIIYCLNTDGPTPTSSSNFQMSALITTPALGSSPAVTFTVTVSDSSCSFGTATTKGTLLTGAFGTQSSSTWLVTMSSQHCHGYIEGKVVSNSVTVYDDVFNFNVGSSDVTVFQARCGNASTATTCTTASENIDATARLCDASALGASCTTPSIAISSWPSLTAAVTLSGTVEVKNPSGQTFALSGTVNTPTTGTLTVTNAGGQTVTISSWPELKNYVCNIESTDNYAAAFGAGNYDCASLSMSSVIGSLNVTIPTETTVHNCGPGPGCNPVQTESSQNKLLDWTAVIFPLGLVLLLVVWAEWKRDLYVYIAAILCLGLALLNLWADIENMRLVLTMGVVLMIARAWLILTDIRATDDNGVTET